MTATERALRDALEPLAEQDCESWGCPPGAHNCEPRNARAALASGESAPDASPEEILTPSIRATMLAKADARIERLENTERTLWEALERIAWHELTWKEARDVARSALSHVTAGTK